MASEPGSNTPAFPPNRRERIGYPGAGIGMIRRSTTAPSCKRSFSEGAPRLGPALGGRPGVERQLPAQSFGDKRGVAVAEDHHV